jgi:hypothetical protein
MSDCKELCSSKVVCKECGGANVQHAMWVCLNTNEPQDDFGSWCNGDNSWCGDCEDHADLVHLTKEQAHLMKLIWEQGVSGKDALASVTGLHNNIL